MRAVIGAVVMLCFIPTFARAQQPQLDTEKMALGEQVLSQVRELVSVRQQLAVAQQKIVALEAQAQSERAKGDQAK